MTRHRVLMLVFAAALASPSQALARTRDLSDDDSRKGLALHDESIGFEFAAGVTVFQLESKWSDVPNETPQSGIAQGVATLIKIEPLRVHLLKTFGLSFGYFNIFSDGGSVADGY